MQLLYWNVIKVKFNEIYGSSIHKFEIIHNEILITINFFHHFHEQNIFIDEEKLLTTQLTIQLCI